MDCSWIAVRDVSVFFRLKDMYHRLYGYGSPADGKQGMSVVAELEG
jgi:hypothetical protein